MGWKLHFLLLLSWKISKSPLLYGLMSELISACILLINLVHNSLANFIFQCSPQLRTTFEGCRWSKMSCSFSMHCLCTLEYFLSSFHFLNPVHHWDSSHINLIMKSSWAYRTSYPQAKPIIPFSFVTIQDFMYEYQLS